MCGRHHVQKVLVEVRADKMAATLGEARVVQLLEKWRDPGRNDRVEYHLRTTGRDLLNCLAVVRVIEGKVLLSDDRATVGSDDVADFLVHRVRPDVIRR